MRALVFSAPGVSSVAQYPTPVAGESDCLVRPRAVGICHSDFDLLDGNYILPISYPVVPGHEWMGEIVAVGSQVSGFRPGDRVVGECSVADDQHFGFTIDGALAEYVRVPAEWLHHIPDAMNDTTAALVEPFSVAYGATDEIDSSDDVVIFGAGPIGLCAVASAHAKGGRVTIVEPNPARRALAVALGAHSTIDPTAVDVVDEVLRLTAGRGASRVVEATGVPTVMADTFRVAAYGAYITNIGINVGGEAAAPLGLIVGKALRIRGQVGSPGIWPQTIRFLERTGIDLQPLVTRTFSLEQAVEALEASSQRSVNIKIHVQQAGATA